MCGRSTNRLTGARLGFEREQSSESHYYDLERPIPASVLSDPTRLRQILMNLVGNAAKFTDQGSITLSVKVDDSRGGSHLFIDMMVPALD